MLGALPIPCHGSLAAHGSLAVQRKGLARCCSCEVVFGKASDTDTLPEVACLARGPGCPELFSAVKNDVIDGYYKKALDSHNVGEAVYRIAIDPKPKLRQSAPPSGCCLCAFRGKPGLCWLAWSHIFIGACGACDHSVCVRVPFGGDALLISK